MNSGLWLSIVRGARRAVFGLALAAWLLPAAAEVVVTPATGGGAISADTAGGTPWTTLAGPALSETSPGGMGKGSIVLNAPAGFEFNTGSTVTVAVTSLGTSGKDIQLSSGTATVTATTVTINISKQSTGQSLSRLTWSGVRVRPTAGTCNAGGNITQSGSSSGVPTGTTSYGTLTESTGAASTLAFVQQPTNALVDAVISPAVSLQVRDRCGADVPGMAVAVALTAAGGATLGGTQPGTTDAAGLATFNDLSVNLAGTYTLTASSTGLTSVQSNAFTISNPATAASFDAVEVGAASATNIYTRLAGVGFSLDILALDSGGNLSTGYAGTVTVKLVDAGSGACAAMSVLQDYGSLVFTAGTGRKTVSLNYANAARNARIRINDASAGITACSTDNFALRPQAFIVGSSANADPNGVSTSATPTVKTGAAFSLTATAIAGYDGTPKLDAAQAEAHGGAVATGTVAGSFAAAAAATGAASGNFAYNEVGYFRQKTDGVFDDTFTSVDQASDCTNDFSNTVVGGRFGCKFGNTAATDYFGRFIPDHFTLTPGSLIDRADINTGATETCSSLFTYMGEDFKTLFTLTARNSSNATTQNYTGGHAKFGLTAWANFVFAGSSGTLQQGTMAPAGSWANGTAADVTATHVVQRPGAETAPHTSFAVSAQPSYTDGGQTVAAASTQAHAGTTQMRFGRLWLTSAYGSEKLDLPVPLEAQYRNSHGFITNADDNCTAISTANIMLGPYGTNNAPGFSTSVGNVSAFASGRAAVRLNKPNSKGSLKVCADLAATGGPDTDTACTATTRANMPYLEVKRTSANYDEDPGAQISFGVYKGPQNVIFQRENY